MLIRIRKWGWNISFYDTFKKCNMFSCVRDAHDVEHGCCFCLGCWTEILFFYYVKHKSGEMEIYDFLWETFPLLPNAKVTGVRKMIRQPELCASFFFVLRVLILKKKTSKNMCQMTLMRSLVMIVGLDMATAYRDVKFSENFYPNGYYFWTRQFSC